MSFWIQLCVRWAGVGGMGNIKGGALPVMCGVAGGGSTLEAGMGNKSCISYFFNRLYS